MSDNSNWFFRNFSGIYQLKMRIRQYLVIELAIYIRSHWFSKKIGEFLKKKLIKFFIMSPSLAIRILRRSVMKIRFVWQCIFFSLEALGLKYPGLAQTAKEASTPSTNQPANCLLNNFKKLHTKKKLITH